MLLGSTPVGGKERERRKTEQRKMSSCDAVSMEASVDTTRNSEVGMAQGGVGELGLCVLSSTSEKDMTSSLANS